MIDRFAKEVVRTHGPGDVASWPVVASGLTVFFRKLQRNLELWQHVTFHVEGEFRRLRGRRTIVHQRAQMIRAQVDFVGKRELGGGYPETIRRGNFLEHLVAA